MEAVNSPSVSTGGLAERLDMSSILWIAQAKPNPAGKDKTSYGSPKPEQLLGEWVDIKNIGTEPVRFSAMKLLHTIFNDKCESTGRTEDYWSDNGTDSLLTGETLRVYTGMKKDEALMSPADRGTVKWRAFASKDRFVLNNKCGDDITVTWQDSNGKLWKDSASYRPNAPEGAILRRSAGNILLPVGLAVGY